ncbi:MAG: ABC transporter permease subunit, partial [Coriobacteriaceae bacterium]|nr:ABC transporter permease subunit [Coriobacteriaceae bacterium]
MIDLPTAVQTFFLAWQGLPVTLLMVFVPLLLALPCGFAMAVVNMRRVPVLCPLCRVFISFTRGVPLIVQIFLIYNSLPSLLNLVFNTLGIPFDVFGVNPVVYALLVFTLCETAILAEVFRGAMSGIDPGQLEAAESVGLTLTQ